MVEREYQVTCFHFELLLLRWLEHLLPLVPLVREQSANIDIMSGDEVIDIIEWLLHGLLGSKPTNYGWRSNSGLISIQK